MIGTFDQGHKPPSCQKRYFWPGADFKFHKNIKRYLWEIWTRYTFLCLQIFDALSLLCPWNLSSSLAKPVLLLRKRLRKLESIRCQFLCWWRSLIGCVITENGWARLDKTPRGCQDPDQRTPPDDKRTKDPIWHKLRLKALVQNTVIFHTFVDIGDRCVIRKCQHPDQSTPPDDKRTKDPIWH